MKLDFAPIKVRCIAQERWFIKRQRCRCGGAFGRELSQSLKRGAVGPEDEIVVACEACGAAAAFQFDISECSAHLQPGWMEKIQAFKAVMPETEATALVVVPEMERLLSFIDRCCQEGDQLALDYIAEAVEHASIKTGTIKGIA